jgi:CBS domain-containing protein
VDTALVGSISAITRRRLATVGTDALLPQAAKLLSTTPVSLVVVCDADGRMAGVISKTDIVRTLGRHSEAACAIASGDLMTREVVSCRPDDTLEEVLRMMSAHRLVHVPVIEAGSRPSGVMEARDALRALMEHASFEIGQLRDYIMGVGYR